MGDAKGVRALLVGVVGEQGHDEIGARGSGF